MNSTIKNKYTELNNQDLTFRFGHTLKTFSIENYFAINSLNIITFEANNIV